MSGNSPLQSRMLQLPGELRNRIYEYASEESPIGFRVSQSDQPTSVQPLFLALTQTCRIIRKEFKQIYMEHTVFSMRLLDAYTFVKAFIAPYGETSYGIMLINFHYGLAPIETNILPLLELVRQFPRLTVRASHPGPTTREALDALLNARPSDWFETNWHAQLTSVTFKKRLLSISTITWYMRCDSSEPRFHLARDPTPRDRQRWHESCFEWLCEQGLEILGLMVRFQPVRSP